MISEAIAGPGTPRGVASEAGIHAGPTNSRHGEHCDPTAPDQGKAQVI